MATTSNFLSLPSELKLEIIRLACVDGGYTARSLCLVSKHFFALAAQMRYHAVMLSGYQQIRAFANHLEGHPEFCAFATFKKRVKELTPTDWDVECMPSGKA